MVFLLVESKVSETFSGIVEEPQQYPSENVSLGQSSNPDENESNEASDKEMQEAPDQGETSKEHQIQDKVQDVIDKLMRYGLMHRTGTIVQSGYNIEISKVCVYEGHTVSLYQKDMASDLVRGPLPIDYVYNLMDFLGLPSARRFNPRMHRPAAFYLERPSGVHEAQVFLVYASKYVHAAFK